MKNKRLASAIGLVILTLSLSGCSFITLWTPIADINQLGTVIKPGEQVMIQHTNGTVTVKYASPTEREICWKGQSVKISLRKSSPINGIYGEKRLRLKDEGNEDIRSVSYLESTFNINSDEQNRNLIQAWCPPRCGYEYRTDSQMIVKYEIRGRGFQKQLCIWIHKYQKEKETGSFR
jgi:hypothetical protein